MTKEKAPQIDRKPDLSKNNSDKASLLLAELKERELRSGKVPLRLNDKTIAMVHPAERNTKKAHDLRLKFGLQ